MDGNLLWQRFNIYFGKAMQYEICVRISEQCVKEGLCGVGVCVVVRKHFRERKFIEKCKCGFC
jgi:hypothetical protein